EGSASIVVSDPVGGSSNSETAIIKYDLGLLLLDPTGSQSLMVTENGAVTVTGAHGAVVVDSNAPSNAAFVTGNGVRTGGDFDVTGGVSTAGHGVVPSPVDHEAATPDPLRLARPVPSGPTFGAVHASGGTLTLSPGTYVGGIAVSGHGSVTLAPGVYYLEGGGLSVTGGSVSGTGVVIINVPGGPGDRISVSGQGGVNLTAPRSGPVQGVAVSQDRASGNPVSFAGQASVTITGVVYAPEAPVNIGGQAIVTINFGRGTATLPPILGALIAYDLQASGNGALTINPDDPPAGMVGAALSA